MSYRKIEVRTAIDTVMGLQAVFDLSNIKSEEYDDTAKKEAVKLHWFIKNNCSAAFEEALRALFTPKPSFSEQNTKESQ